jgi:hypothetical protein
MIRNYCQNPYKMTNSGISPFVNSKDGVDFAMLFALRESRRTSDSALLRVRSKELRRHPQSPDSEALRLLQRWGEATFNAELRMGSGYDPCPIVSYSVFHILCLTIPPEQRPIDSSTGRTLVEIRDFRAVRSTVAVKRWEVTSPAHARPTLAHEAECCFRFCPGGGA